MSAIQNPVDVPAPNGVAPSELVAFFERWQAMRRPRRVLEAGCGSTSHLPLHSDAELVGLDLSPLQLQRHARLNRRIVGDLQSYDLSSERFDLIICWNVLEHVAEPQRAFANLCGALAPGGLLVVAIPNLWSVKGVITKFTPFAVHTYFYRFLGDPLAHTEQSLQFPTYLRLGCAPRRLVRAGQALGLRSCLFFEYEGPVQRALRSRLRVADLFFAVTGPISRALSIGRHDVNHTDAVLVLERPTTDG